VEFIPCSASNNASITPPPSYRFILLERERKDKGKMVVLIKISNGAAAGI